MNSIAMPLFDFYPGPAECTFGAAFLVVRGTNAGGPLAPCAAGFAAPRLRLAAPDVAAGRAAPTWNAGPAGPAASEQAADTAPWLERGGLTWPWPVDLLAARASRSAPRQ